MSANWMYLLRQDGSICGGSSVQTDVETIQELIIGLDWDALLENAEHRIIDSIQLSERFHDASFSDEIAWRMELFPLEGNDQATPAFTCMIERIDRCQVDNQQSEIASLRTIIDAMPFGVAVIKRDKHVYIMNQAALNLAGYSSMEEFAALQKPCQETFCPAPKGQCPVWDVGQLFDKAERPFLTRDGTKLQVLKSAVPVTIEGETMMLEGIIDLRKQKDLERLAYTDPLTGIHNRKGMRDKFEDLLARVELKGRNYTVMMIDLDDFKEVNDSRGHFAGDCVLRFFVQNMKSELQDEDIFCRWGGDEFLIISKEDVQECEKLVQRVILNTETTPFEHEEWGKIKLNFSVGIAPFGLGESLEQIVRSADRNMYHAKREGLGTFSAEGLKQ